MSLGKHFINEIEDPVERGLKCLLRQDQSLRLIGSEKVLYRQQNSNAPKVLLLSGGGSGHEPAHAGYLGEGMLDICVAGQIFASPSASQVLAGLRVSESPLGVLMIVKNYTGDKLNFGLAAQKAKADGIKVNVVFVGDDVSVKGNSLVGRRGLAGVIFVHKIAGALAATGASLDEVTQIARSVADNIFTIGVSLDRCSVPRRGKQESLPFESLEYGMGIHNEPGVRRDDVQPLPTVASNMIAFLTPSISSNELPVAVMINNLGGLSVLELNVIAEEVLTQLLEAGFDIRRVLVGTFVTSLDGPGISVTLLKLQPGFEELLNVTTTAPAWPNQAESIPESINGVAERVVQVTKDDRIFGNEALLPVDITLFKEILQSIVSKVTQDEPLITKYDTIAGDGDCGETLLKGVNAVNHHFTKATSDLGLIQTFQIIATTVERSMGGTSGAIYAIFFNALANSISMNLTSSSLPISILKLLSTSLSQALEELCRYTTARKGHKTLMDALIPFVETFQRTLDFGKAVEMAGEGAEGTRKLDAVLGRASYVGKESFEREGGVPDPGALGVVSVLKGILQAVSAI